MFGLGRIGPTACHHLLVGVPLDDLTLLDEDAVGVDHRREPVGVTNVVRSAASLASATSRTW